MSVRAGRWPGIGFEPQRWSWDGHRPANRADRLFDRYESSVPPFIADLDPHLDRDTLTALNEAVTAINDLERDPHVRETGIAGALLRSESVGSSKIERLDIDARLLALAAIDETKPRSTAAQVWANVQAMDAAIDAAAVAPITADTVHAIHHVLMRDDPHERQWAGRVREMQNWIGGSDECPRDALHVPPAPGRVPALMADLAAWCARSDIAPLLRAAVAHAQFETIHPYTDGNGRTGRALIHTVIRRGGLATASIVPTSSALLADVNGYFDSLGRYRTGDIDGYLAHFAMATTRASVEARRLGAELHEITRDWRGRGACRPGSIGAKIVDGLIQQPVITASRHAAAAAGAEPSTIYRAIDGLVKAGVLAEITSGKRNRVWVAPEVTAALDEFARRVGRRQDGR